MERILLLCAGRRVGTSGWSGIYQLRVPFLLSSRTHFIQVHTHYVSKLSSCPQLVHGTVLQFLVRSRMVAETAGSQYKGWNSESGAGGGMTNLLAWLPALFVPSLWTHSLLGVLSDKNAAQGSFHPTLFAPPALMLSNLGRGSIARGPRMRAGAAS